MKRRIFSLLLAVALLVSSLPVPAFAEEVCTHSYTAQITDEAYLKSVADCASPAIYYYSCECGEKGEDIFESGEALGHSWVEATCIAPKTCAVCGATDGEALGHEEIQHEAKEPNCTEAGWDAYVTCSRCDYSTYVEKVALGHTEVADEAVEATCTATGLTGGMHCSVCNEVLVEQAEVTTLGHSYVDGKCSACGETAMPESSDKVVTAWSWDDEDELIEGNAIGLIWDSVAWGTLVENLPATITATVDGVSETVAITWSCADVAEGMLYAGTHTLSAALPEGYALGESVPALTLSLEMGGGSAYVDSGTCGDNLTWTLDENGTLTISGEGALSKFSVNGSVNAVVIEDGVTSIEASAFLDWGMTSVILPSTISEISENAFKFCSALSSVVIPEGISVIGKSAFEECGSLKRVTLPSTITSIGNNAFYRTGLREIIFPASVREIGKEAFAETGLASATFLGNAPTFGSSPFYFAGGYMINVYYPANDDSWTTFIENETPPTTLGAFVTWIKEGVDNTELTGTCGANLTWVLDENGTLEISGTGAMNDFYSNYSSNIPWNEHQNKIKKIVVNQGVTSIGKYAFLDCINVTSVTLPSGIKTIGDSAFYGCDSLSSIQIPNTVTSIGTYAFHDCDALLTVAIPNGVSYLGYSVFSNCQSLTNVTLPSELTTIPEDAFWACPNLTSIAIPNGVTGISDGAFYATGLQSMTIPASVTSIGNQAFGHCDELTNITFLGSAPTIAEEAFYWTTTTTYYPVDDITWTEDVMQDYGGTITWVASSSEPSEGENKCGDNLTWTLSEDGVLTISGTGAMFDYDSYTNPAPWAASDIPVRAVIMESGVTSIGDFAFSNCTALTTVSLPSTVTTLGNSVFGFCTALTDIRVAEGNAVYLSENGLLYKELSENNYMLLVCPAGKSGSIALKEGTFGFEGTSTFINCSEVTGITLPKSMRQLFAGTISYLTGLQTITFTGNAPTFEGEVFDELTLTAYYPAGDATWTEDVQQNYGGTITWVASGGSTCPHTNLEEEWDTDYPMTYTSISDTQHTVSGYANKYCLECFQDVGESYPLTETANHSFNSNGDCTLCDYRKGCAHTQTKDVVAGTVYTSTSTTQHTKSVVYDQVCANAECGVVLKKGYRSEGTGEAHNFEKNVCTLCGYGVLTVTTTAGKSSVHVGENISATAEIKGGVEPYTIYWTVKKGADVVHTAGPTFVPTISWETSEAGSYSITARVVDAEGTEQTKTSGAIKVEDHDYESKSERTVVRGSGNEDGHTVEVKTYKICSVCQETTTPETTPKTEPHNNGSLSYESAHPHKQYRVCKDCGYATYSGTNQTANGSTQSQATCCICHGHVWGDAWNGSGNSWYKTCSNCGLNKLTSAPVQPEPEPEPTPEQPPVTPNPPEPGVKSEIKQEYQPMPPVTQVEKTEYPEIKKHADLIAALVNNGDEIALTGVYIENGKVMIQAKWDNGEIVSVEANMPNWSPVVLEDKFLVDDCYRINVDFFKKYNVDTDQKLELRLDKDLYIDGSVDLSNCVINMLKNDKGVVEGSVIVENSQKRKDAEVSFVLQNCNELVVRDDIKVNVTLSNTSEENQMTVNVKDTAMLTIINSPKPKEKQYEKDTFEDIYIDSLNVTDKSTVVFQGDNIHVDDTLTVKDKAQIEGKIQAETTIYSTSQKVCAAELHTNSLSLKKDVTFGSYKREDGTETAIGKLYLPQLSAEKVQNNILDGSSHLKSLTYVYYGDTLLSSITRTLVVDPNNEKHNEVQAAITNYENCGENIPQKTVDALPESAKFTMEPLSAWDVVENEDLYQQISDKILLTYADKLNEAFDGNKTSWTWSSVPEITEMDLSYEGTYIHEGKENSYKCDVMLYEFGTQFGTAKVTVDGVTHTLMITSVTSLDSLETQVQDAYDEIVEAGGKMAKKELKKLVKSAACKLLLEGFGINLSKLDSLINNVKIVTSIDDCFTLKEEIRADGSISYTVDADDPKALIDLSQIILKELGKIK